MECYAVTANCYDDAVMKLRLSIKIVRRISVSTDYHIGRPFFIDFFGRANRALSSQFYRARRKNSEPGKTTNKQCWIKGYQSCVRVGRASDEIALKTMGQEQ